MEKIKEHLSTLRYELIEKYGYCERENLPSGTEMISIWKEHIDALMAEVPYYDYELEKHTKYREKGVTLPDRHLISKKKYNHQLLQHFFIKIMKDGGKILTV